MFIHLPDLACSLSEISSCLTSVRRLLWKATFRPARRNRHVVQKNPRYMLHGHEPLTRNFSSPAMLGQLKTNLSWLRDQVLTAIRRGDTRAAIHQANLIPPGLLNGRADALCVPILREHVIDRLYHQNVGYWQADLEGLDHLGDSDRAELLVDYLGLSEKRLVTAAEKMAADGKYELALLCSKHLQPVRPHRGPSPKLSSSSTSN